jgi:lysophospholipase L1-like esterase
MLAKRLVRLLVLVLVYVLVAEAGLQIAAFFVRRSTRAQMPVAWVTGNLRVLCLGDSNTYGLWLDHREQEAYPQQLEALWNARVAAPKLEVLNLGFPGTNSSRLVRDLPDLIDTLRPDILIVMVGVNDFWTLPVPIEDAQEARPQGSFLARHSLIYRLFDLARRGQIADQVEIVMDPEGSLARGAHHKARVGDLEFDMGFTKAEPGLSGDAEGLKRNLHRLVELARAARTPLYLMTYASTKDFYRAASEALADVAAETGTPLIDLATIFAGVCPTGGCPDVLYPDGHLKARGYATVAETVLEKLDGRTSP